MTDYSRYNSFIKKNSRPYSYRNVSDHKFQKKEKWIKKTFTGRETIVPGDKIKLLFDDSEEIEIYTIVENYMETKPIGSNNPKGDIRKHEYKEVPSKTIDTNELSTMSDMYDLIKNKRKNDIVHYKGQSIKIIDIIKKSI